MDLLFVTWNKATIESFQRQIKKTGDPENRYKNELAAFKEYIAVSSEDAINHNSIRYQFLTEIQKTGRGLDFFIIESNRSGEVVEIVNYVVYFEQDLLKEVLVYQYLNGKWKLNISTKTKLKYDDELLHSMKKYGEGSNQDNVVITRFSNYKVDASEFYIYSTLSKESAFSKLLSSRP
jgi:hypothetical protein